MILKEHLASIGFADCVTSDTQAQYEQLIEQNNIFYQRVVENQPDKSASYLLLGLLTKLHIESIQTLTTHLESIRAMKSAIQEGVGDENASKFELNDSELLTVITQAWLFVQGYRDMDFSLANDHALETAELISKLELGNIDETRTELVRFYYLGQGASPKSQQPSFLARTANKLKHFLNG